MRLFLTIVLTISGFITPLIAQSQTGIASVRPLAHEGTYTQAGAIFSHDSLVASHRNIPFGSIVKVTNLKNQKSVDVLINDRGPFINGRIIDLSEYAGQQIGLNHGSLANVRLDILKIENNYTFRNNIRSNKDGNYTVKLGSFSNKENAVEFASELATKYKINDVTVKQESYQNKPIFKVYTGKFLNRDIAEKYLSQLPGELKSGYVTTLE
jgi:rare lipoprotein A